MRAAKPTQISEAFPVCAVHGSGVVLVWCLLLRVGLFVLVAGVSGGGAGERICGDGLVRVSL